jgi:hypothetical protein
MCVIVCAVAVVLDLYLVPAHASGQDAFPLETLTVSDNALARAGCRLPPAAVESIGGNQVRLGLWDGLPISSNPWTGTDTSIAAAIVERIDPPSALPDGPPLSRTELARFRARLADDVESAYAAVYADTSSRVVVLGVRYTGRRARPPMRSHADGASPFRVEFGRSVILVSASESPCSDVIRRHIAEVVDAQKHWRDR